MIILHEISAHKISPVLNKADKNIDKLIAASHNARIKASIGVKNPKIKKDLLRYADKCQAKAGVLHHRMNRVINKVYDKAERNKDWGFDNNVWG